MVRIKPARHITVYADNKFYYRAHDSNGIDEKADRAAQPFYIDGRWIVSF